MTLVWNVIFVMMSITAIPQDVVSVLLTIASQCRWVCEACRSACRGKLSRMSAARTKATEDAAFLATTVSEMRDEIRKLDSKINGLVPNNVAVNKTVNFARRSEDGQRTQRWSNIAESFNLLSRVHQRYRQTDRRIDDRQTDDRRNCDSKDPNVT